MEKLGFLSKNAIFSATMVNVFMNETGHAHRKHIGLVCCIMFAHLTEAKGHQGP